MSDLSQILNILHDGGITSISATSNGRIRLTVEIQYLTEQLVPPTDAIEIIIQQCQICFRPFKGQQGFEQTITDLSIIARLELEILSAKPTEQGVELCCVEGLLEIPTKTCDTELANGSPVTIERLIEAANKAVSRLKNRG